MSRPDVVRRPRVLVLNHFAKPRGEPGSSRHTQLFNRLVGWEHLIIAGDRDLYSRDRFVSDDPEFAFVAVLDYEGNGARRVLNWVSYAVGAVGAGLRGPRPSVVYGSSPHLLAPVAALVIARLRRARLVVEVRDLWPRSLVDLGHLREGSLVHRVLRIVERVLYRSADRVVVVTDGMRGHLAALGVADAKVVTLSNGACPADFGPDASVQPLRERIPVRGRLLVFAGAHGPKDGLDHILDAARALPDETFVLIGDGADKARAVDRARDEDLGNVHFLGLVPKTELCALLGDADIGLHTVADVPVFALGMSPNKLYDYLAAGLPVVTNAPGEPHRIVEAAGAGVGVGPRELADGIKRLLVLDRHELDRRRGSARDYMRTTKCPGVVATELQRLMDELCPGGRTTGRRVADD